MKRINEIKARMAEIQNSLEGLKASEAFSQEDIKNIQAMNKEFNELKAELETLEQMEANLANASTGTGRKSAPAAPSAGATPVATSAKQGREKFGGFETSGDFLMAVRQAGATPGAEINPILKASASTASGEDGGFLIPEDISTEILKKLAVNESLFGRTRSFTVSGNTLTLNVDETQPWNSGIQAYWIGEGKKFTESKANFTQASWKLHKLGVLVLLTDELLDDARAMESYIKVAAPEAIMHKLNDAILVGDGVAKPKGILQSGFTVVVPKEAGQLADTIKAENVINMYSRMFPSARAGAEWVCEASVEPELWKLKDGAGQFICLTPGSQMNQSPYTVLLGRPVRVMMSGLPGLGSKGDLMFINLAYYYTISKGGVKSASSIHMMFDREMTAFRFSLRVDGSVPFTKPVKTEKGNYEMSAFVALADRE